MNTPKNIIKEPVYWDFVSIASDDYRAKVRFYEQYSRELSNIDYHLWVEIKISYINALFEIRRYHKVLQLVDALIEEVVIENIYADPDPYEELLYKKAASLYNNRRYDRCSIILLQLIKINPQEDLYKKLFRKSERALPQPRYLRMRSVSLLMMILVVPILMVELLIINTLFPMYDSIFQWFRISMMLAGAMIFFMLEYSHIRRIEKQIELVLRSQKTSSNTIDLTKISIKTSN